MGTLGLTKSIFFHSTALQALQLVIYILYIYIADDQIKSHSADHFIFKDSEAEILRSFFLSADEFNIECVRVFRNFLIF